MWSFTRPWMITKKISSDKSDLLHAATVMRRRGDLIFTSGARRQPTPCIDHDVSNHHRHLDTVTMMTRWIQDPLCGKLLLQRGREDPRSPPIVSCGRLEVEEISPASHCRVFFLFLFFYFGVYVYDDCCLFLFKWILVICFSNPMI